MTKKEYCLTHDSVAYYSGINGLEIRGIEYGTEDYIYSVSNAWYGKPAYHKSKIFYSENGDYFKINGYKIPLNECIRMGS